MVIITFAIDLKLTGIPVSFVGMAIDESHDAISIHITVFLTIFHPSIVNGTFGKPKYALPIILKLWVKGAHDKHVPLDSWRVNLTF